MEKITVKQGSNKIVVFVDKITYLMKQGTNNDCLIYFGSEGIKVNHTIDEVLEMIEQTNEPL